MKLITDYLSESSHDILSSILIFQIQHLLIDIDNPLRMISNIHQKLMSGARSESDYSPHILLAVQNYEVLLKMHN